MVAGCRNVHVGRKSFNECLSAALNSDFSKLANLDLNFNHLCTIKFKTLAVELHADRVKQWPSENYAGIRKVSELAIAKYFTVV